MAAVFRSLATLEGTLTQLAPGFDLVAESRAFAAEELAERLRPEALRRAATDEFLSLLPLLRRVPRRLDRIGAALEEGRFAVDVRLFADDRDRRVVTGPVHQVLLAVVAVFRPTGGERRRRRVWPRRSGNGDHREADHDPSRRRQRPDRPLPRRRD